MSGAFIHGHPVIGLPGLQDWTGGYADYQHDGQTAIKVSLEEILGDCYEMYWACC